MTEVLKDTSMKGTAEWNIGRDYLFAKCCLLSPLKNLWNNFEIIKGTISITNKTNFCLDFWDEKSSLHYLYTDYYFSGGLSIQVTFRLSGIGCPMRIELAILIFKATKFKCIYLLTLPYNIYTDLFGLVFLNVNVTMFRLFIVP